MSQPKWKFIANLGDANPIDHGGLFLYEDTTGVYPAELERLERASDTDDSDFVIHRVVLDRCKIVRGETSGRDYLVPISYDAATYPHPLPQYEEWFAEDLAKVASYVGSTESDLREALCSEDSQTRAIAYQAIYDYHGWANGDSYPLTLTLDEVESRYTDDEVDKREPIDRLHNALEAEHCNACTDNNTCDINQAFDAELYLWAAHLLIGATECPRTTAAYNAMAPTKEQLTRERDEMLEHPHMQCPKCDAIVWTSENKDTCGDCLAMVQRRIKVENSDDTDTDEEGHTISWVIVTTTGVDSARWAKQDQQSLGGSRWESDGSDFAYNKLIDSPTLLQEIKDEVGSDVEVDDSEYCPPNEK